MKKNRRFLYTVSLLFLLTFSYLFSIRIDRSEGVGWKRAS